MANISLLKSSIQQELMNDRQLGSTEHLGSFVAMALLESVDGKYETLDDLLRAIEKL